MCVSRNLPEHSHLPKKLRRILERILEVVEHRLLLDRLLNLPPCVQAEWVRIEMRALAIAVDLHLHVPLVDLLDKLCE